MKLNPETEPQSIQSSETQTSDKDSEIVLPCNNCLYNANCEKELRWHVYHSHNRGNPEISKKFICKVCFRSFQTKSEMMFHTKREHKELVPRCRYFINGECNFSDTKCWFHHSDGENQTIQRKNYKCNFCEKEFQAKDDLMVHRKCEHSYTVPECKNKMENTCKFGNECWYKHVIINKDN